MALYWSSWEAYVARVQPSTVKSRGLFESLVRQSSLSTILQIEDSRRRLEIALEQINILGYATHKVILKKPSKRSLDEVYSAAVQVIRAGEELLLYHARLAEHDAAYGFLHQNELPSHWSRYIREGNPAYEIYQLYQDAKKLLDGLSQLIEEDQRLIIYDIQLPPELEADFRLARNLFSVGFDDVGLLIAGRGLEGVLRKIAEVRKIMLINAKGNATPVSEADAYDLIEAMYRIRWKVSSTRLISSDTRTLLHYLRTLRNEGAHANTQGLRSPIRPRETATIVADTANRLWHDVTGTRARLAVAEVKKDW